MVVDAGRWRSAAWAIAAGVCGFAGLPAPCLAAAPTIELSWSAPAVCPDRREVLHAIRELAGETEQSAGEPDFSIRGEVQSQEGGFLLNLSWRSAAHHAERTMTASTCDELARAAALIVALAVNPGRLDPKEDPSPAAPAGASAGAVAPVEPGASAPRREPLKPAVAPRRAVVQVPAPRSQGPAYEEGDSARGAVAVAPSQSVRPRAEMAMDVGTLPHAGTGVGIGVSFPTSAITLQAEAFAFSPQTKSIATGGGGKFWMGAIAVRPCFSVGDRFRVLPCVVTELEVLYARGQGVDFRQAGAAWFPRFGLGGEMAYALSKRFGVVAGIWLLAGPFRPNFVVEETEQVHRPAIFSGRSTIGLDLQL